MKNHFIKKQSFLLCKGCLIFKFVRVMSKEMSELFLINELRFFLIHSKENNYLGKEERRLLIERLAAYNSNERPVTMESSAIVLKINLT